jgi:hypothetical protein
MTGFGFSITTTFREYEVGGAKPSESSTCKTYRPGLVRFVGAISIAYPLL